MAIKEDPPAPGAPEWITTFVDMTSLLVTFFILLLTFSTMEEADNFPFHGDFFGMGGSIKIDGTTSMMSGPDADVMAAMDATRGADVPHVRPPEALAENLEEMGQKLLQGQLEIDPNMVADGIVLHFDERAAFAPGSTVVNPVLAKALTELARVMEHYPNVLVIEGHTDSEFKPTPQYPTAEALACARARAAAKIMLENSNLTPMLLQVAGLGSTKPLNDNSTPSERTKNRRVEVRIQTLSKAKAEAAKATTTPR